MDSAVLLVEESCSTYLLTYMSNLELLATNYLMLLPVAWATPNLKLTNLYRHGKCLLLLNYYGSRKQKASVENIEKAHSGRDICYK